MLLYLEVSKILRCLIWVYTVCKSLSVPILRVITVYAYHHADKRHFHKHFCYFSMKTCYGTWWVASNEYHNICFCGEIRKIPVLVHKKKQKQPYLELWHATVCMLLELWHAKCYKTVLFVCVEVLQPSQPNGVMSSSISLPNHMFTGQA